MRKKEVKEVRTAIMELMEDEPQFTRAVGRLCRLVGWRYPASEVDGKPLTIQEAFARPTDQGDCA